MVLYFVLAQSPLPLRSVRNVCYSYIVKPALHVYVYVLLRSVHKIIKQLLCKHIMVSDF